MHCQEFKVLQIIWIGKYIQIGKDRKVQFSVFLSYAVLSKNRYERQILGLESTFPLNLFRLYKTMVAL